ncbi:MAG: hypothetical protein ACTHK8_16850 [Ginsengibacter sp.]
MTYYINDSLVTIEGNGVPINNRPTFLYFDHQGEYTLNGKDSGTVNNTSNLFQITFEHDSLIQGGVDHVGDSLQVRTYEFSLQTNSRYRAILVGRYHFYGLFRDFQLIKPTDHFTCTISRISNGTADGTFSGVLSTEVSNTIPGDVPTAVISKGKFTNVPIRR